MKNWLNKHRQAAPANTAQPPATAGDDSALILRDLMSPDGYARERALHQLAPAQVNGPVLSAVLLRLNDWVPQVRQAAQEVLRQLSAGLGFEQLQAVLPALQALERGRRADHSESLDLIRRSLTLQVQGMSEAQRQRLHDLARRAGVGRLCV
ncbi:hypothetical protein CO608_07940 [Lysobacteraceae bacterium NML08-0793]|nr:hypothetical protein CO608_07940 [Xanthomonadaceae bacterium NML08-0793]